MKNENKALPQVTVELGGERYVITCSFGVLRLYQHETGNNPFAAQFLRQLSPDDMVTILWAGIKLAVEDEDPKAEAPSKDWVANHMSGQHMRHVNEIITKLFEDSLPEAEKKALNEKASEQGNPQEKKATTTG